jgi:hypothetical protein
LGKYAVVNPATGETEKEYPDISDGELEAAVAAAADAHRDWGLATSVSERALRPAVLWRKGSFGSDSEGGSRFAERLLTVALSCRQQGRPLLSFLVLRHAGYEG